MKRIILLAVFALVSISSYAQGNERKPLPVTVEIGALILPSASNDNSLDPLYLEGSQSQFVYGAYIQAIFPTKYKVLNWMVGANVLIGENRIYQMNGGAVYAGLRTRSGNKNYAFISEFAIGIYSIKDYNSYSPEGGVSNPEYIPLLQATTFGGQFSFGFELGNGSVSISPQITMIAAGGAQTSLLLWGLKLPLTITF